MSALRAVAPGSLGAVFAAQVVEHLALDDLRGLLSAAHRALREDGILIVETVNPHNAVALKLFWVDPTHRHPIFPEALVVLCRQAGFRHAGYMLPGHEEGFDVARRAARDYAVIAREVDTAEGVPSTDLIRDIPLASHAVPARQAPPGGDARPAWTT